MHNDGFRRGWVVNATPGHLSRGPHYTGGRVYFGVNLDGYGKSRLHQNLNLRLSKPWQGAIPSKVSRSS
jgi:hypothetical protein